MKFSIAFMILAALQATSASAEMYSDCKATGGSENGLAIGPKQISFSEAQGWVLKSSSGSKPNDPMETRVKIANYFEQIPSLLALKGRKVIVTVKNQHFYDSTKLAETFTFDMGPCGDTGESQAVWSYSVVGKGGQTPTSATGAKGMLTYDCTCGED
jgi:hypothetical protein